MRLAKPRLSFARPRRCSETACVCYVLGNEARPKEKGGLFAEPALECNYYDQLDQFAFTAGAVEVTGCATAAVGVRPTTTVSSPWLQSCFAACLA
jgi:hypothetical protein